MPNDLRYVYLPFADVRKSTAKTADGIEIPTRIVSGVMTDETVDLDGEIVDYDSAKKAANDWFRDWGNVREQHTSNAIGTGIAMVTDDVKKEIRTTIEVVDPLAIIKIDKGVLKGQSVGLKGARAIKDATAPHGRLVGFTQVEDSLVDRPSNPTAKFAVTKSAKDGSLEIGKALQISEAQIQKIATAEQNKLATTEPEDVAKGYTPDSHGHLHTHNAGSDQEYEHDHGHDHVGGLHADGKAADHQHDHYSKAAKADATKDSIVPGQAADGQDGPGPDGDITAPSGATAGACPDNSCSCGGCGPSCTGDCCEACTMADDLDRRESMHFAADADTTKSNSEEDAESMYAKAAPQLKALLEAGDAKAALAILQATELVIAKGKTPEAAPAAPVIETPPVPEATKAVEADTMKAAISEAVTKAVEAAITPLREKVDEMARRAAPGGPQLGPSKLLSAPDGVKANAIKARLEDIKDAAENHPDYQVRAGAKAILEKMAAAEA